MIENGRIISRDLEEDEISIDLLELFGVILRKIHIIIMVGAIFGALTFVGTKTFVTPQYTSTTKMYVLSKQSENAAITYSDLETGRQLTQDYMELVKSRPVLEKVIAQLNLDMDTEELKKAIKIETPQDTRILSVSIDDPNPEMAKKIVDAIREAVSIQITQIMDAESVNTVEEGNLPTAPSSPSILKNTVIGAFLGCLLAGGFILLRFMLDDTIKTPDDVEKYLGLSVLASVPIETNAKTTKKKRVKRMKSQTRLTRR